ncbi:MAG: peptidoglycan DD-metalloendopeptidase family protein [Sulfurovaceae bacterium]|nr:peptidoglycan DD-metalloendopeptidase family protein [Sulfurovaceae bacterium]
MKKIIILLLMISSLLWGAKVTQLKWKSGEKFSSYLQTKNISLSLLKSLDELEQQVVGEIQGGQTFYEIRDDKGTLVRVLIPISSTMQIKLSKDAKLDQYRFSIVPINFKETTYFGSVNISKDLWRDISNQIHNDKLILQIKKALRNNLPKLQNGDNISFVYAQKTLVGYLYGSPNVYIIKITQGTKEQFIYVDDEGIGHKEPYETVSYMTDGPGTIFRSSSRSSVSSSGIFSMPIRNPRITSPFSFGRYHPVLHIYRPHFGVDFGAKRGTPIMSIGNGIVTDAGWLGGYGKAIKIQHSGGYVSIYGHLSGFRISAGDNVRAGDIIGYSGNTGTSTGPHLHLGIYLNNSPINPMTVLEKGTSVVDTIIDTVTEAIGNERVAETKKIPIYNAIKYRDMLESDINNKTPSYDWDKYESQRADAQLDENLQ